MVISTPSEAVQQIKELTGVIPKNGWGYTADDTAEILGIGRNTAFALFHSGRLPIVNAGKRRFFCSAIALWKFMNGLTE